MLFLPDDGHYQINGLPSEFRAEFDIPKAQVRTSVLLFFLMCRANPELHLCSVLSSMDMSFPLHLLG